jgi:hypothetical protein
MDTDKLIDTPDTNLRFYLPGSKADEADRRSILSTLCSSWSRFNQRNDKLESEWITELSCYFDEVADMRINHVCEWISSNLSRFKADHAEVGALRRVLDVAIVDLKASVQLCKMQCSSCHLLCLLNRGHAADEPHDCQTDHHCMHLCDFCNEDVDEKEKCGYPYVLLSSDSRHT